MLTNTFICIASGPSLVRADCLVALHSGHPIIAVNSSWEMVPECAHIFAADLAWWSQYSAEISSPAQRWTSSALAARRFNLNHFYPEKKGSFNSGQQAIELAAQLGAAKILLLGYDCCVSNGTHWHGDHPQMMKNPDAASVLRWREEFQSLANCIKGVEVINCSRRTTLTSFTKSTLETVFNV